MPYFSVLSPDDGRIYTTCHGSNELVVTQVELDRGKLQAKNIHTALLKRIPVGNNPVGATTSQDGKRVYVANYGSSSLSVVGDSSLEVVKTLPVGQNPYWVALHPQGDYFMVSNYGSRHVDVFYKDLKRSRIEVRQSLVKLYFSPDGRRVFTTNYNEHKVGVIE
jgi:YVTN family beta-propeller protein